MFVVPALKAADGWQLVPVLALETIRLVAELGGRLERDLRSAVLPITSREELLERINIHSMTRRLLGEHTSGEETLAQAATTPPECSLSVDVVRCS